jgi:hypothetical protein
MLIVILFMYDTIFFLQIFVFKLERKIVIENT